MKSAVIIGASSGIGKELAIELAKHGYRLGLTARRTNLIQELQLDSIIKYTDLKDIDGTIKAVNALFEEMGSVDLVVINSGTGYINLELDFDKEKETIDVNVSGFVAIAGIAAKFFEKQSYGHIVGISSIAALRGMYASPAYCASKAFMKSYLQSLRQKYFSSEYKITVTEIMPGFVDTPMAKGDHLFWVASPQKAARQIFSAIRKKKNYAYITKRWCLIAWVIKLVPEFIFNRVLYRR